MEIKVYSNHDGHVDPEATTEQMVHVSTMTLTIDSFGNMEGTGIYLENPDYDGAENETYSVKALKRSDITALNKTIKQGSENELISLCDISASIDSWIISSLSDGIFRPIGNCYYEKDGGGYYIYGRYGPGSLLPIYTQTVYYPLEWSWCKVRRYNFDIKLQGNIRAVEALKWVVANQPPTNDFYAKIGFETIAGALIPNVNKIYYFAGENISDHWYLRRSDYGVCNTPLLFCYVLGTNQVEYN